ncbi:MAG: phosphate acyltransferase PlsX [Bacillota bacterium]
MNKVVVDAFGGDNAPLEIVKGAILALKEKEGFGVTLVGKEEEIKEILKSENFESDRIEIVNATEVITNDDVPTSAIRSKKDSSLVRSLEILKQRDDLVGFISAGSTGAVLAGALFKLGRLDGIARPALAPCMPAATGREVVMLDIGANVDCKPEYLVQFAIMGSSFLKKAHGNENPRVALLSNGVEDKKGNELNKKAFKLLQETKGINFVGNMEAREILSGDYDVIVTDGFAGNIGLKATEGAILTVFSYLKQGIMTSLKTKIAGMLLKDVFKQMKGRLDYNANGGAVLLGVKKPIVKCHGSSKAPSIAKSIHQCLALHESKFIDNIESVISENAENEAE